MVYTARTLVIGMNEQHPFMGFILASKSLGNRRLEVRDFADSKRIYVFPAKGHELDNIRYPEVDNYACIILQKTIPKEKLTKVSRFLVGFNGHMAKRCTENILDGMNPFLALDSTLFEFRGLRGDARIGGVISEDSKGNFSAYLGINDTDRIEKRIRKIDLQPSRVRYVSIKDTSKEEQVEVPCGLSSEQLAEFLAARMIPNLENLIATGICILKDDDQEELSVYNTFK